MSKHLQTTQVDDAVSLLKAEHRQIEQWFSRYNREESESEWQGLMKCALTALKVHMELEEEIFYPAYLAATDDGARHHDAMIENEGIKKLIEDVENSDPGDEYYESMVRVLWKMVERRIAEEERPGGMLTAVHASSIDLSDLGHQITARREELVEVMAMRYDR